MKKITLRAAIGIGASLIVLTQPQTTYADFNHALSAAVGAAAGAGVGAKGGVQAPPPPLACPKEPPLKPLRKAVKDAAKEVIPEIEHGRYLRYADIFRVKPFTAKIAPPTHTLGEKELENWLDQERKPVKPSLQDLGQGTGVSGALLELYQESKIDGAMVKLAKDIEKSVNDRFQPKFPMTQAEEGILQARIQELTHQRFDKFLKNSTDEMHKQLEKSLGCVPQPEHLLKEKFFQDKYADGEALRKLVENNLKREQKPHYAILSWIKSAIQSVFGPKKNG